MAVKIKEPTRNKPSCRLHVSPAFLAKCFPDLQQQHGQRQQVQLCSSVDGADSTPAGTWRQYKPRARRQRKPLNVHSAAHAEASRVPTLLASACNGAWQQPGFKVQLSVHRDGACIAGGPGERVQRSLSSYGDQHRFYISRTAMAQLSVCRLTKIRAAPPNFMQAHFTSHIRSNTAGAQPPAAAHGRKRRRSISRARNSTAAGGSKRRKRAVDSRAVIDAAFATEPPPATEPPAATELPAVQHIKGRLQLVELPGSIISVGGMASRSRTISVPQVFLAKCFPDLQQQHGQQQHHVQLRVTVDAQPGADSSPAGGYEATAATITGMHNSKG
ncbi:hypothetical protein OEZ85_014107 [Tetradesmus obliquus]|uniref:Uncharacterized protein n=1 Tax=Tetradesmus obliquus TaxID=3088 RepID=A0ABY8U6Y6_TETOB|nr:hypothetical protein OEZ85_014107 [Tetradesmus obliquus]